MDMQLVLAMSGFALVTSATPGPNNLMLLASGANHGFRRTIPHMLGISLGMALLLSVVLAGLGEVFVRYPLAQTLLKVVGVTYLLWLAWKILNTPTADRNDSGAEVKSGEPMRWWQASAFQFVNPKAWMMSVSAVSSFTLAGDQYFLSGMLLVMVFALVNLPSISMWAGFGTVIQRYLSDAKRQRMFNIFMGTLTAATVFIIIAD